jgi:hypothetical protein
MSLVGEHEPVAAPQPDTLTNDRRKTPQNGLSTATEIWLWHKDRDVVTYSDGVLRDMVIAIA